MQFWTCCRNTDKEKLMDAFLNSFEKAPKSRNKDLLRAEDNDHLGLLLNTHPLNINCGE